jgi:hypothetical protein
MVNRAELFGGDDCVVQVWGDLLERDEDVGISVIGVMEDRFETALGLKGDGGRIHPNGGG